MDQFDPGIQHERTLEVTPRLSAMEFGSGDVPVLATPAVLALAEGMCAELLMTQIEEGQTSVGTRADVRHDAPTVIGRTITLSARPTGREGRRWSFEVDVREGGDVVAHVSHQRVVVDRQRFLDEAGIEHG